LGKRTAVGIMVLLRERVAGELVEGVATMSAEDGARAEAREGLIGLGYTPIEAERLLGAASGDTAEELVASALRNARAAA
jgi:Holliday junction DNA helicase RuvA